MTPSPYPRWLSRLTVANTILVILILFVALMSVPVKSSTETQSAGATATQASATGQFTDAQVQQAAARLLPTGKPFYGDELGISYDDVEKGLAVLGQFDAYGSSPIKLTGEKLKRYIAMGTRISCEFCCGAKAVTTTNGDPACGCAHSQAMRGVAIYLLDKYGDTKSDAEIFAEMEKWKALSFPQDTVKKFLTAAATVQQQGSGAGASQGAVSNLPKQVGGC